jgi:hypothetical protein
VVFITGITVLVHSRRRPQPFFLSILLFSPLGFVADPFEGGEELVHALRIIVATDLHEHSNLVVRLPGTFSLTDQPASIVAGFNNVTAAICVFLYDQSH